MAWSESFEQDKKIQDLFEAFDAIESGDPNRSAARPPLSTFKCEDLETWVRHHSCCINDDIVVVDNVEDSHRGKRLLNMGSPLYNAVVRDIPEAAKVLLLHGADPNYAHPSHGDTPLLHSAERGYDDCLRVLLETSLPRIDTTFHMTADRRFMLGQGLPQYEEGGLNPLSVAVRNGRVETTKLLLSLCPPLWVRSWIFQTDSIGQAVIQNVSDYIALADSNSKKLENLKEIYDVLAAAGKLHSNKNCVGLPSETLQPTREEASERLKKRNLVVRERCLAAEKARKEKERKRGLQAIEDHYKPRHLGVYTEEFVEKASTFLSKETREPISGVFNSPLIDPHFCSLVWEEIHNYEMAASSYPKLQLPLRVRHDGNIGDLQDCGFRPLLDSLAKLCRPILTKCLPASETCDSVEVYHAFLTRNYVGREGNVTFRMHQDKSLLTINVCLHASDDFSGSTVGFYSRRGEGVPGEGGDLPPGGNEDRIYTHAHEVGHTVVHSGKVWHRTDPITNGTRGSLIIWLRRKEQE